MAWSVIGLTAAVVAERVGPDAFSVYLTALGVAAVALAFMIVPDRMPGRVGRRGSEREAGGAR